MSLLQSQAPGSLAARKKDPDLGHRIQVSIAWSASILLMASLAIYGASYYLLPIDERPYSPKHALLRPSGVIGLKLGILGTILFFIIFLYALRKVIPWLGRMGTARHWMDFHVVAGVSAPVIIAFHASFKFRGIAGVAFWIMVAVALSGVIGRYLYSLIPRSMTAAELSQNELQAGEQELAEALASQEIYSIDQLKKVLDVPSAVHIRSIGPVLALGEIAALDCKLPFQVAGLRRQVSSPGRVILSLGGLLTSSNTEVEHIVRLVRQKAALSRRMVFLSHTQRVFHLWHVIHRPFSYAFAVLAIVHIVVVIGLGFGGFGAR